MMQRPKPGEGEEELLRMQEEYLQEKSKNPNIQPAAQVTSLQWAPPTTKRSPAVETGTRKPSKYAQSKGLTNHSEKRPRIEASTSSVVGNVLEKNLDGPSKEDNSRSMVEDDKVYFPTPMSSVLGNIVEKNLDAKIDFDLQPMPSQGFPEVTKRSPCLVSGQKSIHRQNMEMKQDQSCSMDIDNTNSKTVIERDNIVVNLPKQSYMVSSEDANDIHNENVKLLTSMSEKEILEEQHKLLSNLDPKLVQFFMAKRQGKASNDHSHGLQSNPIIMAMATSVSPDVFVKPAKANQFPQKIEISSSENLEYDNLWDNEVLTHPKVNEWLNFDSLEKDKLQWMSGIQESKKVKPDEPYEARFDFTGYLLPYTVEYTEKTKTFFHHGEEPNRPGYSLTELIELTRSTITQQRVMALNTVAGILEYYNAGTYKDVIDLPLSKIFFIIRIAMDENKVIVLEPALKAMRNLLYNRIDEASLDALIGFEEGTRQPWLENDKSEIEELESKESELKDFHLAEIDLIAAILRTDILQRLYYILDIVRPPFNCVQYAIQILTRLARDSDDTSKKIIQSENLMKTIIRNFLPSTSLNFRFDPKIVYKGKPILSAVRLLRILSLQDETFNLVDKYEILKPISEYISSGVDGTYGLRIQIEAYCALTNLLSKGLCCTLNLFPVVITTLHKHVQGTDISVTSSIISVTHAAVIMQLMNKLLLLCRGDDVDSCKAQFYPLLIKGTQKWIKQISQAGIYTYGHLRLLCAALDCSRTAITIKNIPMTFLNESLMNLASSHGFKHIIKNLELNSNLLSGLDNKNLHLTKNLMNLGGSVIDSALKVLPIFNETSPVPFLASLFKLLTHSDDKIIAESFLPHILPYFKNLVKKVPALTDNWFTRMEVNFVFDVLKLAAQHGVSEPDKYVFYAIANKLSYVLNADKSYEIRFLFEEIIFNKHWFTAEKLFHLMNLSNVDATDEKKFDSESHMPLNEIKSCYERVISSNNVYPTYNIHLLKWREPLLPRDWIYMPILALYSRRHYVDTAPLIIGDIAKSVAENVMAEKKNIISCSLEWILFNELCFPDLLNDIDVTDRFCRIMCVFLCDDSLFLDTKINKLLFKCSQTLFKRRADFNFDKDLVGLHNFEDFYTEILQQFQSVSYGDPTFASCVLVPLARRHNVKWRQLIWYEYVGCLRYLDCPEDLLCYPLEDYFQPPETDRRVLESYHRAISMNYVRKNTVAHRIALHSIPDGVLLNTCDKS